MAFGCVQHDNDADQDSEAWLLDSKYASSMPFKAVSTLMLGLADQDAEVWMLVCECMNV